MDRAVFLSVDLLDKVISAEGLDGPSFEGAPFGDNVGAASGVVLGHKQ